MQIAFKDTAFALPQAWSSPFVRWQGSLADLSSLDLAVQVAQDALRARGIAPEEIGSLCLGSTIPQRDSFYAAPWIAQRLGMPGVSGPHIAQACATSVACLVAAAQAVAADDGHATLVLATDRTSNGPTLLYPRTQATGGSPEVAHWVLDSFAADPGTARSMAVTAENVARDGGFSRQLLDDITLLRYTQYTAALAHDRAFQRPYMQAVAVRRGKQTVHIEADEGVHAYSAEGLQALRPGPPDGTVTFGNQTHPADGTAGLVLRPPRAARAAASGGPVVHLRAAGFARAASAEMPKAATLAAQAALAAAGLQTSDVHAVQTHNPFAVNDAWLSARLGVPLEAMNTRGCSLIYGHPQGPTGLRGVIELAWVLQARGGGIGLFTGCAAGDTGAALVIECSDS